MEKLTVYKSNLETWKNLPEAGSSIHIMELQNLATKIEDLHSQLNALYEQADAENEAVLDVMFKNWEEREIYIASEQSAVIAKEIKKRKA